MDTPSELLPVYKSVFQAVTEANRSFQKLVADLDALQQVSFFPTDQLTGSVHLICRLRAEINVALMKAITDRETSNALYYDRLYSRREQELKDPGDVLPNAEQRKKEMAGEEEQRMREEQTTPQENPM
jgi:hypothetical protein